MLKSFSVDNFKNLVNVTVELSGLNLFLGPNNAGKTNLCRALQFLSLTAQMPLDEAVAACTTEPWNVLNVYTGKETLTLVVTCELTHDGDAVSFTYELVVAAPKGPRVQPRGTRMVIVKEVLRMSGGRFADTLLLENNAGRVRLLHEKRFLRGFTSGTEPTYVDTAAPVNASMLFRLFDLETNQRSNLFKRYLASWGYYNLDPARLRSSYARAMDIDLQSDGGNLSSVLFSLHSTRPREAKRLLEAVKLVEPRLDLFSFQTPDPDHVYMFFEDRQGNRFGIESISDGTIRYLAMSYLILCRREETEDGGGPPVTVIEEPENGIFVGQLKPLFERINLSGSNGQFAFTSHSPYFIDLFDAAIEGLFILKPGESYSSVMKPDPEKLQERLGKFSLGELHFRGLLE